MKENIMNTLKMTLVLALVLLLTGCNEVSQTQPNADGKTYVLVHGAWGGGWAFREVDDLLTAQGHKVYRPTLTGQGERVHLATLDVGLETHITDVVNTVLFEELDDIVLMGHSYGGMVVTGVADRIPDRISQLIYLDAFVPEDGQSVRGNKTDADWTTRSVKDGYIIPTWVPAHKPYPKDVPHPRKTLTDKISLKNPDRMKITTDYILTVDPGKEPKDDGFYDSYKRAKQYNWTTHILSSDHNPQWSKPNELYKLLNDIPAK